MPDNVDKLFEIMQANGAANDRNKFRKVFLTPGNKGYKIRKDIYDGLRADGIIDSPTYEDFRRKLRLGGTPTVNKYRQQMFNSADPTKNKASELTRKAVKTAHKAMDNVRKPVRGAVVNKQGKKVKEFDITPAKTLDDLNREYAQEVASDWEKEQQRQSLYNTTRSLDEVQRKIAERDAQLDEADNGFWTGIRHAAQGMNVTGGMFQQYDDDMRKELIDPKYKQYLVEANYLTQMKKQLIQEEEDAAAPNATKWDRFKHASSSFTSGMLDEAFGSDAFDFGGYIKMRESDVLLRINDRINRGVATDDDRRLLQILKDKEEVESRLDNDAYSFGRGASQSAGFVTDFLITGGGDFGGLGRLGGKMALGLARKTFAKTMTKDLGKRFAAWSLKNLGKTLGEATGAAMTATSVQVGKTAANATQRYLGLDSDDGGLEYDKDGNLKFKGGTDVGTAIAKAIASGTIENYTELLGPHITSMGKRLFGWAGVGLEKITPDALSKFFDKVGSSELFKRIGTFTDEIANSKVLNAGKKALAKVGVNDMPEEGLEEEAGIILNSLITGDNKFSDLWDKETQYKTWGGVMSMMGAMRAIPIAYSAVGTAYSASKNKVEYFKCKHDLTKAETLARQALGNKWTPIKELIDNADNKHIIEVGINIIRQSDKYSQEQAKAAQNYIGQLLKMRGFNNATMASIRDKNAKGEGQTDADKKDIEVSNAYAEGHEAEGELRHQIQLEYEKRTANLAKRLGLTPEKINAMNVDSFSSYIGLNSDADFDIFQYKKAKAAYDGVMDNAQNLVDIAGEVAAQRVDNMTNVHDGTIRKAYKKGTEMNPDSPVYIISGNIKLNDDGSINYTDSDKMLVVYDEETGQREAMGNFMLASVDPNIQNAEEVKAQAIQAAKQKIITEQSNVIDGILAEGSEFTMESNDGSSHNYKIVQVDEQGNCIVSVDGTVLPEPLSLDAIQQQYDQSNVARSVKNDQTTQESEQTTQEPEQIQQESQSIEDKFDYDKITNENDGKVKRVDVTDEEGKNRFPNAKAVFLIQDKGAMPKFVVMDEEGNLTSYVGKRGDKIHLKGEMTIDEYKKQRQEELQMIAAENADSSMIEDNSGTIEVEDNTQPLSETDADNVIAQMESSAETAPDLELTPDNWTAEFGEDGILSTPIGDVKMGENQVAKLFEKGRSKEFGMIKPTLTNPDVIIEVPSRSTDGNEERSSSYLFIKTFLGKNGKKVYYFKSVTIKKDGLEISISSHYDRVKRVKEALMKGKLLYRKNDGAQTEQNQPSASVTTSQEDAAGSSESKDTNISSNGNENNESLTFEDGTPIPVDMNGEVDLSQTDASHAAEWYDNNLGEDADDWLDGEIKKAKKVLEQAKNKKLAGTKPSELVASKKEKEAAIADAQAHYDSAISIRDSLKERRIEKVEDTAEGRKELIEKARRKFARLKSAVKNDAEAVSQLYRETIGSLLHRLYDSTGIDVTDTTPLTAEEYVASNLGAHSLNYEGTETSKGVKQETGLSREDFAKTQLLAADGKGTTIDALVHSLWENRPSNLESLDTQDIRNALIGVLNSGFKASEARNFVENIRIAQAENILEEQKRAQENAAYAEQQKAEQEAEQKAMSDEKAEPEAKSEEKLDNESDNESNDLSNETDNEQINDNINDNINAPEQNKFPDKLKEGSKTIEVPEDATDEKPLGEQRTDSPFSARKNGKQQTEAERAADVEKNKVDDVGLVDAVIGEKIRKSFERIAKMMGAKIQYQRTDKLGNGWIQETTDADGNVHRTIFITLDSSITKGAQFIFGHEMTHQIKHLNPAAYNELTQLVLDTYGSDAFDKAVDETMQRYSDAGFSGRARDYYAEEVVADAVGEMIRDLNLAHTLAMKMSHPLLAAIHEILQKIKLAFFGTEYSDVTKNIIRSIEQAYVKTANGEITNSETGEDVSFSLRQKPEPKKKGIGYKVFVLKDGKLYPPMVANPDGAATPVGVWLDADAAPIAGESKTGRPQVKQGGKGTQGGSGKLAYRPGWHLGVVPYAIQFNRKDAEGNKTLFPKNFVFAEVEYAADVDYQEEARQEGINPSGKYQHSLAGLKHLPTDGYYMYRTNPNPETDPWVITGAMKVNRILTRAEQAELVKNAGREPQQIQEGDIVTDDVVNSINQEIADAPKFSLKSKPVRFEAGKKLSDEEKKEVLSTLKDAYKVNGVPYHIEETAGGKEKRVYEPTADSYVVSDITNRPLRYYITLPDGRVAHPTEVYPNISDNEVKSSATKQGLLDEEVDQIVSAAIGNMKDIADNAKAIEVLTELQNLPHETHDVGYGMNNAQSYNYKTGIFTSDAAQAIDYVVRRMRRKEDVPTEIPAALKKAVADSYGMVDNLIGGMSTTKFSLKKVNDDFNQRLEELVKNPNQKDKILRLGRSSSFLKVGGITDAEIELDFDKFIRKSGDKYKNNHPFAASDLINLPMALAEPIAVFNSTTANDHVVLTELQKDGKNFIVAVRAVEQHRKGGVVLEVNKITSLYPKEERGIVYWINNGRISNVDKEKALHFIEALQPHAGTTITDEELKSAANIINSFETTKGNGEKVDVEEPKTFEEFLNHPSLKFSIKNEQQRKAAEDAYEYASKLRPNKSSQYALVDMSNPSNSPEYYEKKVLADRWRRFYNKAVHNELDDVYKDAWGNYKLFDLDRPFADQVNEVKGDVPNEFNAPDVVANKNADNESGAEYHEYKQDEPSSITYKDRYKAFKQREANREKTAGLRKERKETEDSYNSKSKERVEYNKQLMKEYMDEHGLSSENDIPYDVWDNLRSKSFEKYQDELDSLFNKYKDLDKQIKAVAEPRFSLKDEKTLAGVHNITEEKLRKALKLGGFANPSLAVIDTNKSGHNNFGEISFIAPSALLDKRTGKTGGTWITDAYTQRYPSVERQMSEKGSQKFEDWVDSLEYPSAAKAEIKRQTKDVLEDNGVPAWELMYLKEKGIDIKAYDSNVDYRWKEIINDHPTAEDILSSMQNDPELNEKVTSLAKHTIIYPTWEKISLEVRRKMYKETGVKASPINPQVRKQTKEIFERDYKSTLLNKDGSPRKKDVKKVVEDIVKEHNDTKKYDFYLSKVKASNYVNKNGLYDDYIRWQENKLDEFGTKNRIFRGYTRDGSRKYVPETLENVSKAMREEADGQTNGSEYTSFGSFIAKLASRVDSTDEMRANKDKLSSNKDKEEFYEKWSEVYYDLAKFLYNDVFYGEQRLHDIVLQSDPKKYAKKEYGITLTPTFMKKLDALKNAVQTELKSAYFETKYNRPLRLNEFAAAVVPDNLGEDVRKGIENAGLPMYDYDPNKEGDRSRAFNEAINSSDNIRFSLKSMMEKPEGWKQANKKAIHIAEAIERDPKFSLKNLDGTLIKAGTYFSGGGLVEEGLKGIIDPVVAVEYDEKISGVYRNNFGQHIVTADVRDVDPKELVKQIDGEVEYFHASPVCKNYSQAKSNHAEVELDKETAASTAEFINAVKPKVVTIENVKGYKDSEAMKTITDALDANGYTWDADVYNAADYGGYTNRERLIVRAVRDGKLPEKPKKMAHKSGWYEAVADIISTLTEKKNGVAPWMDIRLKADGIDWRNIDKPLYVMGSAYADGKIPHAFANELLPTLRTKSGDVIVMPDGKVYRAIGRVLARVSGVSDDYKMPFSENLSHTIIGNGIPTQLTEHVIAPLLQNTLRPTTPEDGNTKFSLRGSTPYGKQMEEWMEKNHLEKGAVPMEKPIMKEGENIFDYANRMVEWTRNQNLWKTAPKQTGFQDALDKWKADNGLSPNAYPPVHPHRENYSTEIGYAEDLEEYNKKKELWKSAPKPKDFDLSVDLEDMNKQLRNIRRAVLNQKNYDQRTVKAVSDLVRKMLNIGWGDGLSRGKVGNLLSAAKNATGANDVKKYLDKAMGILAENYLNRLSTAYDNLINTKGARADQSGVIKMGSLDAKGQAFMSEYKKAINMDDSSLNTYIANIEEDSAKNEDNVEMNDYRLAGIQAAIMYKQQIGGNDADIAELKRQIGELKNKKDATKEDKDLLKSLEKKLFENKFDRITMYENLLNNIQRMVKESKGRAKEFREEIAEHKNEILHRANLDLEGVDSTYYDTTTAKKKFVNNDLQRAVFSSTYTFEQFLKFFGKKAANGEGYLYNYFTKLNQDALDEEQLYNEMNRNALDEKTKELFGKEKFMKLVGIDGKGMKEMDVEVTDYSNKETGKRTIHLKQGQMLYIYLVNKETDGEMKLRAMGITEEDVAAIEENLDPRVKAMGEWLQDEYLPECQRRYQATHTKYFGAPMKEVENYFPLAINNRARNVKEDVNQDSDAMSQLAGTSTGAIVTRRVNVIPLDIENADAFEVAFNHLQEMEEWSAMLPFRQDINTLLSYTHFRNQVQNMSSVAYGSGKTLWDEFKQTAQIAAGTYKPKVNAGMMDSRIAAAMGGIAVAKISGRLWTAIKQSQSATVFLPECDFTRFVKNGVNPYGSWKWAMENIPDFRKRVENMTYGDVKLRQYLDELEKWHDWTKTISKIGMAPNILVDGITCAVGARSVYETEVNRLTKLGYPKEKAEEKAYYKAVAAYNKTQQSSGGMYLSPMQVDRTYASAALSLFKNANFAYGRMQIEACRGLARTYDFWGGKHKTTLIESMTRQIMEEDGLDENTARAIAKATYNRTFRQSIGRLINFATLVPVSWALYKVLPYLLTGDDDDKKKDMIEEAVLKGFATSLSDNYVIPFASNILNAGLKVEDGKPTFDPEVFKWQNLYINPATSDLANIYSMIGNQKWYSVANKLGMLGVQSLIGFNPETVGALYQAFAEADYDNGNTAKEWQIGILKAISAPEETIRELYMDELGLKSGDIKKIPLAELEKRYAERQINRDNLLSQIGMDAETFNGYVDKYQKSFEKKIKDKMDKWDEYDKKKADEFFDTTSDTKLKDMIEKKRTKDANAAADEQIAKEGLNQEKKGKEPSEEAYDAVKMSIDVAEDNAISTYNKVLNKRYAALNDEYNEQTDAMKYIFMSKHPYFKAYKDLESEYTTYGKKMKELKEKLVSADGYDAKQTILKQIRAEREKFSELQSKVR